MVQIADLVARFRGDTSDLERSGQVAKQTLQGVQQQAEVTARAFDIMAQQFAKLNGGTAQQALEMFHRSGAQPTATALAQAAREMENTAAAATKAIEPTRAIAKAAADHAEGWKLSESSLVRFGTGLLGIGLGISIVGGAAKVLHDTIGGIIDSQLQWERSLVQVRALYGDVAQQAVTTAQAQAVLPGVAGGQQTFLQAAINARYLTTRYGVAPSDVTSLTTAAGRAAGALGYNDEQAAQLQQRFLDFAENGGTGLRNLGIEGTPLSVARQLGIGSEAGLQALTPGQLRQAQLLIETYGGNRLAATATDPNSLLTRQAQIQQALNVARGNLAAGGTPSVVEPLGPELTGRLPGTPYENFPRTLSETDAAKQVTDLQNQLADITKQLGDASKSAADAARELKKLGVEVGGTTARLLSFTGSLEDVNSIARADVAAQAQGAVAQRAIMAVPAFGRTQGEIVATAQNTAYQNAYQNFVAQIAQGEQGNAIREELERRVQFGPANQRAAAQRALEEAKQAEPVQQRLGEANRAAALVDIRTQETQSQLEQINLTQRERYVQLLRDTVDLRKLDVQQQQASLAAQMDVIRATQAAQPALNALSDAQYTTNRAGALARARTARVLQGKDVSGFPSISELINQNVQGQLAAAEAEPGALDAGRAIEVAQRTATARGLAQQLTAGQLQQGELANDLKNLGDLPSQTALMLEDIQNSRDALAVQKEIRDLNKDLVKIITGQGGPTTSSGNSSALDEIIRRVAVQVLGTNNGNLPAMPELPGARRGPS